MKIYLIPFVLILLLAANSIAQEKFLLKDVSKDYDVQIDFKDCDAEGLCHSEGTVYLFKKNQKQEFQKIQMPEMYLKLDDKLKRSGNLTRISGSSYGGVYFEDVNFDGIDDLGISNGYYKPYGGVSYDIFLFSKSSGKFVINDNLTQLADDNMWFDVNVRRKTIETSTKSGCCWYNTTRYKFIKNRLVKIYSFTEDAQGGVVKMRLITERLIRGKLRKTVKIVRIEDYYKEPKAKK